MILGHFWAENFATMGRHCGENVFANKEANETSVDFPHVYNQA